MSGNEFVFSVMDGTIKHLLLKSEGVSGENIGFKIADSCLCDLKSKSTAEHRLLKDAFEWAVPFGGLPILYVVPGSVADTAGMQQFDVIFALSCDISHTPMNKLPCARNTTWQLTSATTVEYDLSRIASKDFAALFRSLLGNPVSLTVARSLRPISSQFRDYVGHRINAGFDTSNFKRTQSWRSKLGEAVNI